VSGATQEITSSLFEESIMSASSSLSGDCSVCAHSYNEHNRFKCKGSDKKKAAKGKYTYEKCKTRWYVCQQGGHDFAGDRSNAYMVCRSCAAHPGGGPDGSGPDGTYYTPSGGDSTFTEQAAPVDEVTMGFGNIRIDQPPGPWSEWAWQNQPARWYRTRQGSFGSLEYEFDYENPGPEEGGKGKGRAPVDQSWSDWVWDDKGNCYYRTRQQESGGYDYQYDHDRPGPGTSSTRAEGGGHQVITDERLWSNWTWDEKGGCYYRTRQKDSGGYDYEYKSV
jgi:hypothetical protein